ncbi:MAG: multidrug/spermidine transporter subunit MdtI [Verrucomicrobia bacterium]|nr:MAG: multidrug/spermidine transporter subunit MdtI [Verrucomicrobiota bacterium]
MLPTFSLIHLFYLLIAIVFELICNYLLKLSDGFTRKTPAVIGIIFVLGAFTALSFAIQGIQLSVAYCLWGGIAVIATAIIGIVKFKERLRFVGWIGVALIILGMVLIEIA